MNTDEIKAAIHADYQRVLGKVIFPFEVDGYVGDDSFVVALHGLHPCVVCTTNTSDLERPMGDGHWDPCWDIQPLYPEEFQLAVREALNENAIRVTHEELRSMWVYGHSYREGCNEVARSRLRFRDSFTPGK
jgi:hypothetical protein